MRALREKCGCLFDAIRLADFMSCDDPFLRYFILLYDILESFVKQKSIFGRILIFLLTFGTETGIINPEAERSKKGDEHAISEGTL